MPGPAHSYRSQRSPSASRQFRLAFSRPATFAIQNGKTMQVRPAGATVRSAPPRRTGPFNPNARLVPGNSVVRASGIKFNAVPRPGDLRSAAISLSRGQIPQGSLLGNIVNTVGRAISGGRAGVPRHVAPVPAPALNSITPNMVNQSDAGRTVRGALRRRLGTRTMRPLAKPRRTGGPARAM